MDFRSFSTRRLAPQAVNRLWLRDQLVAAIRRRLREILSDGPRLDVDSLRPELSRLGELVNALDALDDGGGPTGDPRPAARLVGKCCTPRREG